MKGFLIALSGLILLQGVLLFSWLKTDTRPLGWDEAIHTRVAYDYQDRWNESGITDFLKPAYFNYPPLYHMTLATFLGATKDIADNGALVNFIYLILLILGVFFIGDFMLGRWPALAAAVLVSCYPVVLHMTRITIIDVPLTAWVTWAIYCLLRSESFTQKKWSWAFGAAVGLGMLVKWTALAYVLGPLAYVFFRCIKEKRWKVPLQSILIMVAIMLPWYSVNFVPMMARIIHVAKLPSASGAEATSWLNWLWYGLALFKQMNLIWVFLFLPGLAVVYWKPKLWPITLWFVISVLLFTLIGNRNIRYSLPALPAAALLSVAWLPPFRKWSFIGIIGVALILLGQFFKAKTDIGSFSFFSYPVTLFHSHPPQQEDWKHDEIISAIDELRDSSRDLTRVVTVSNVSSFHSTTLNISLKKRGIDNISFRGPSKRRWMEFSEFILLKTGHLGPEFTITRVQRCSDELQDPPDWFSRVYKIVNRWSLPDGSEAILYQAKPDPMNFAGVGMLNLTLDELVMARIKALDVEISAIPLSEQNTRIGKFKEVSFKCREVHYKRISFKDVHIRLIEPHVNLPLFLETQEIQFLSLGKLQPQAIISSETLLDYAHKKLDWLEEPSVLFENDKVQVQGKVKGIPLMIQASIVIEDQKAYTKLEKIRFAGIPFPLFFIRSVTDQEVPLTPNRETPFTLDIKSLEGEGDQLKILS